jgi:hypothetical protein
MKLAFLVYIIVASLIGIYAVLKERVESGCVGLTISKPCCDDENSVYIKGTQLQANDTLSQMLSRLHSCLSVHEKAGIWKKCYILGTVMLLFVILSTQLSPTENKMSKWTIISLHLIFISILYFYNNYNNYHIFRKLKNNGEKILTELNKRYS